MTDLQKLFDSMTFENDDKSAAYNSRVLIIDALNTFIRSYCAVPTLDDNGNHVGGMVGFMKSLGHAIKIFKPTRVVLVFDGKGGSQRRRELYPEYKANRKMPTRLNRAYDMTEEEQEKENMKFQLVTLVEILECLPVTTLALENVEADDVIAYFSELVVSKGGKSIIYSTDKDFLQLVSDSVTVYNPVKKKSYLPQTLLDVYGIDRQNFVFYRALLGDKSDSIEGIRGAGEKTVLKYIPELGTTEPVTMDLIRAKYAGVKKVPKLIESIISNESVVDRNLQLMSLSEVNISVDAKMKVFHKYETLFTTLRKLDLTRLLIRSNIHASLPNYDEWVAYNFGPLTRFHQ